MTAGLFIRNDDNILQIDENYQALALKEVITRSFTGSTASGQDNFTVTASENAVFAYLLRSDQTGDGLAPFYQAYMGNNTWEISIRYIITVTNSYKVYVFDNEQVSTIEPFGLLIRNAAGDVVYHTSTKPLRVIDFNASRTCAVLFGKPGWRFAMLSPSPPVFFAYFVGVRTTSTGIALREIVTGNANGTNQTAQYYCVDVTNY